MAVRFGSLSTVGLLQVAAGQSWTVVITLTSDNKMRLLRLDLVSMTKEWPLACQINLAGRAAIFVIGYIEVDAVEHSNCCCQNSVLKKLKIYVHVTCKFYAPFLLVLCNFCALFKPTFPLKIITSIAVSPCWLH